MYIVIHACTTFLAVLMCTASSFHIKSMAICISMHMYVFKCLINFLWCHYTSYHITSPLSVSHTGLHRQARPGVHHPQADHHSVHHLAARGHFRLPRDWHPSQHGRQRHRGLETGDAAAFRLLRECPVKSCLCYTFTFNACESTRTVRERNCL